MMLQALCELAQREHLVDDPAMELRPIDYVLQLDLQGRLMGLVSTVDEEGHAKKCVAPRIPKKSVNVKATPLADNAKYVLGVQSINGGGRVNHDRLDKCKQAFVDLLREVMQKVSDPAL